MILIVMLFSFYTRELVDSKKDHDIAPCCFAPRQLLKGFSNSPGQQDFQWNFAEVIPPCSLTAARHLHTRHLFCQFLVLVSVGSPWKPKVWRQLLTTDRFGFHGHLRKATAKAWSLKTLSLQKGQLCSTHLSMEFPESLLILSPLKASNIWSAWIQLMCFFACHCLHLCRRLNNWRNPEVFDLMPLYNRFMIDGHPLPQRSNRHSRWHFPSIEFWQPAWGGNFGRVPQDEENRIPIQRCCPLQRYLTRFFIWRMRKHEPLQVFQLEQHQGLSNPKLRWCCAGDTIHRWGLDRIKQIAVL